MNKEKTSWLNVDYDLYNEKTRVHIVIAESGDFPAVTNIVHKEPGSPDERVTINDEDLPLLIEALTRRYQDSVRDNPDSHPNPNHILLVTEY